MATSSLEAIRSASPAILPSLLRCDFGDLKGELEKLSLAGTKALHLDVMDGQFVPNLTYGMPIVEGLRRHTDLPLDVHLMISDPLAYAKPMVDAGADLLTFHIESVQPGEAIEVIEAMKELGVGVGIALNPETPIATISECLPLVDLALVMSVEAGFGGQSFNTSALEKLRVLRQAYPELLLQIDGGIDAETIGDARAAGCDLFVVGSAIFKQADYCEAFDQLRSSIQKVDHSQDQGDLGGRQV
ncbi:ribulose-phosphate 3-epimerase [bacterium]|nr:ribulose-phosphate 3-epimerase [bacterium]